MSTATQKPVTFQSRYRRHRIKPGIQFEGGFYTTADPDEIAAIKSHRHFGKAIHVIDASVTQKIADPADPADHAIAHDTPVAEVEGLKGAVKKALIDAGYTTVGDLVENSTDWAALPGIGDASAQAIDSWLESVEINFAG